MRESMDLIHSQINYSSLTRMRVCIFQGELTSVSMDKEEVVSQPTASNDTILEISQQNALAIQNLEKDVVIIKRSTTIDNDINSNKWCHLYVLDLTIKHVYFSAFSRFLESS